MQEYNWPPRGVACFNNMQWHTAAPGNHVALHYCKI